MQHLNSIEVNKHLNYWIFNFQNTSQPLIQTGIQKFIQRQPGMMEEYFSNDSEVVLKALENEVDYEQKTDQNYHLAVTEASTAVDVCMDSSGNYTTTATTITTVHKKMDLIWKREEGGNDEVDIKAETEIKKKEKKWEKKAAEVLWQTVYET